MPHHQLRGIREAYINFAWRGCIIRSFPSECIGRKFVLMTLLRLVYARLRLPCLVKFSSATFSCFRWNIQSLEPFKHTSDDYACDVCHVCYKRERYDYNTTLLPSLPVSARATQVTERDGTGHHPTMASPHSLTPIRDPIKPASTTTHPPSYSPEPTNFATPSQPLTIPPSASASPPTTSTPSRRHDSRHPSTAITTPILGPGRP